MIDIGYDLIESGISIGGPFLRSLVSELRASRRVCEAVEAGCTHPVEDGCKNCDRTRAALAAWKEATK